MRRVTTSRREVLIPNYAALIGELEHAESVTVRRCVGCGVVFVESRGQQRYCGAQCRRRVGQRRYLERKRAA
jgi:hypothetical protein